MQTLFTRTGTTRAAAWTLLAFASSAGLFAEQAKPLDLRAALALPTNPFTAYIAAPDGTSSSVSGDSTDAAAERSAASDANGEGMQPPPRRRYGRPRYTDNQHNADGSNKIAFEAGAGFTLPTGGTHNYLKTNFNFQAGVGRNFNKNVGVIAQFDYARFGIQTSSLNNLLAIYDGQNVQANLSSLGGSNHIWSFTLNPVYTFAGSDTTGAYVVAGVGFYHKVTDITTPATATYCDYYYGCYQYQANQTIDSYVSNAVGVNGGVGFTYKPSRFANERLFAEARYVFIDNQPRPFFDGTTGTSLSPTYFNAFPQNSRRTTFIPVTFGVRF